MFKFGSELGNELFYITFLPFVFWNVDDYIGRRLIILWVFNMYAGMWVCVCVCGIVCAIHVISYQFAISRHFPSMPCNSCQTGFPENRKLTGNWWDSGNLNLHTRGRFKSPIKSIKIISLTQVKDWRTCCAGRDRAAPLYWDWNKSTRVSSVCHQHMLLLDSSYRLDWYISPMTGFR